MFCVIVIELLSLSLSSLKNNLSNVGNFDGALTFFSWLFWEFGEDEGEDFDANDVEFGELALLNWFEQ